MVSSLAFIKTVNITTKINWQKWDTKARRFYLEALSQIEVTDSDPAFNRFDVSYFIYSSIKTDKPTLKL